MNCINNNHEILVPVPAWRKRYVQENAEGLYTGATLLIAYDAISIPFAFISSVLSACVIYP